MPLHQLTFKGLSPGRKPTKKEVPALPRLTYAEPGFTLIVESTDRAFLSQTRDQLAQRPVRPARLDGQPLPEAKAQSSNPPDTNMNNDQAPSPSEPAPQQEKISLAQELQAAAAEKSASTSTSNRRRPRKKLKITEVDDSAPQVDIPFDKLLEVAKAVRESPYAERIQQEVLQGDSPLDKLLVSTFFGGQVFGEDGLTADHLEAVTKALGVGMTQPEIFRLLMRYNALFTLQNPLEVFREADIHRYNLTGQGRKKCRQLISGRRLVYDRKH